MKKKKYNMILIIAEEQEELREIHDAMRERENFLKALKKVKNSIKS